MAHHRSFAALILLYVFGSGLYPVSAASLPLLPPVVQSISYTTPGQNPIGWSFRPAISADGRFIAFASNAPDLVPGDTNTLWDVFVRDRLTGLVERVSLSSRGEQGDGNSGYWSTPSISADGRFVAFASLANNLVSDDLNQTADVFIHDRLTGLTELVSRTPNGSSADGWSDWPAISADGRYVSFTSFAEDLTGLDHNAARDIFRYDRSTHLIELASVSSGGAQTHSNTGWASAISADGQVVAFASPSKDLFPGDRNSAWDVFVRDFSAHTTEMVSISTYKEPGNDDSGYWSSLGVSADGARVVFQSNANTLSRNDRNHVTDIFVHDRRDGSTLRASLNNDGNETGSPCLWPAISPDGRYVTFTCQAANLVKDDTNAVWDVFLRDLTNHHTSRISTTPAGDQSLEPSGYWNSAPLSNGAEWIAFPSQDARLTGNRGPAGWNVYLVNFPLQRGMEVVKEARRDLDMPYCKEPAPTFRGCPGNKDCDGPYHGFTCGVCTDLILDAFSAGTGLDLQLAAWRDRQEYPNRAYTWSDMRSAQDMRLFFGYTKNLLSWNDPFFPGDAVFFDWDGDALTDHVALVSLVDPYGHPLRLISAQGPVSTNPDGLTHDIPWKSYHQKAFQGHARP
ncbi:MAG TPA: hypothetical protein VMT46_05800 [Anaerolineaceae bacterium]|nr:hypothetical protein [Anaerolineaceae bacterium]